MDFELDGRPFVALNGGPEFTFDEAVSFQVSCKDQDEVDFFWGCASSTSPNSSRRPRRVPGRRPRRLFLWWSRTCIIANLEGAHSPGETAITSTAGVHETSGLQQSRGGTAYDHIQAALAGSAAYREFRAGRLDRDGYTAWVEAHAADLAALGLNADQRNLSTRFPLDEEAYVDDVLDDLRRTGVLDGTGYPHQDFAALRETVAERFDHDGRTTYIFPEEARLLYALAYRLGPRTTVFLGSYYGYWAVWALPGILAGGGHVTLIDTDPAVMDLARRNLAALGLDAGVEFVVADATVPPPSGTARVDLCVLDAEGPKDCPDEELRDKAIYHPIMRSWTPELRPGGLLVAHNMLLGNLSRNVYFDARIAHNRLQYARFERHLREHYDVRWVHHTSEGVGVYRRGPQAAVPCAG